MNRAVSDALTASQGLDIRIGDCITSMQQMPSESVHTCVTSPPYFGLRDYGVDGQIGLEATPDEFVAAMVAVFREVRRVLRDDGTLWLNLGDSYAAQRGGTHMPAQTVAGGVGGKGDEAAFRGMGGEQRGPAHRNAGKIGLKHKDLIGIPWRVAFALQADGWYLRQDIIWAKPNPMPESVRDRCTKSHEYLFLLTKSPRYYFDADAIAEPLAESSVERLSQPNIDKQEGSARVPGKTNGNMKAVAATGRMRNDEAKYNENGGRGFLSDATTRNKRSVWTVTTKPFKGAHFATFPPDLIEPCILAGCPEGGTVLDPFGGSGTTAGVALAHGRQAILCELNPEYAAIMPTRIQSILTAYAKRRPANDNQPGLFP